MPCASGDELYCEIETNRCLIIDAKTGAKAAELKQTRRVYEDGDGTRRFFVGRNLVSRTSEGDEVDFAVSKPWTLSAAYGPAEVCVSFVGGPCVCFDSRSGRRLWEYKPPDGSHVLTLEYSRHDECFYGVEWPYEHGGHHILVRLERSSGSASSVTSFKRLHEHLLLPEHNWLLTHEGRVIELSTGREVASLKWQAAKGET